MRLNNRRNNRIEFYKILVVRFGHIYNESMYKCSYFGIKELVSPTVYNKWGERAWMFFDEDILKELDFIRETYKSPIIINSWNNNLKQCGLRSNLDEITKEKTKSNVLYLSAHTMGKAFDLHCHYGHNEKLWQHLYDLIRLRRLKKFKRLENKTQTPTWVHTDTFQSDSIVF